MLLNVENVIPYLLEQELLDAAAVVDGDVRVVSASRRNRNFRVMSQGGGSLLLKQAESAGTQATLSVEGRFYRACWEDAALASMRPILPRFVGERTESKLLVLELLKGWVQVHQCVEYFGARSFMASLGRALGSALGRLHATFREPARRPSPLSSEPPWILFAHRPGPDIFAELSAANMKTLRLLQRAELAPRFDELRGLWRAETVVHGDIKSDNILIEYPWSEGGPLALKIVDWELAQVGDPAWDVGAVFKDLLALWVGSMRVGAGLTGAHMAEQAGLPLESFQVAWRNLWRTYGEVTESPDSEASAVLERAVRYSAAWLVQSAYESAARADTLGNHAVMLLQLASNILANPAEATTALFGLPSRGGA